MRDEPDGMEGARLFDLEFPCFSASDKDSISDEESIEESIADEDSPAEGEE
ncbi:hypothetical protein OAO87_00255 [bacterium]|nr:hypothetical protein [bacterium]